MKSTYLLILLAGILISCNNNPKIPNGNVPPTFLSNTLTTKETNSVKKVKGQLLFLPVYSNIPYFNSSKVFDLSAFITFHNTDLSNPVKITRVLYFDKNGKLVKNYLSSELTVAPLSAMDFFVPESDKSGTGASFMVEWVSDTPVNEPLVESVMIGLKNSQGVSFLSTGKVLREVK
jgi:Protein of unknown function (DUF3124).